MACAIENKEPIPTKEIRFMGPAKQEFDSLKDQANYFLDTYWPNWKNYDEPQSYILPPVFKFKHPEVSDEAFKDFQKTRVSKIAKGPHELISDRISDQAEHMVYNAIQQLIDEKVQAPFIAVHNLDLRLNFDSNKQLHGSLKQIFPDMQWEKFQEIMETAIGKKTPNAEFDFVLIGPKIGIIAIEVKSSSFNRDRHFTKGKEELPENYKHGIAQLQAANALIFLLQQSTGISMASEVCVQKILCSPNLKKARFDDWVKSLTATGQAAVKEEIGDVKQWFEEDTDDLEKESKKPVYWKVLEVLKSDSEISRETFEEYCPIIAAIASTTSLLLPDGFSAVEMNKFDFSAFEAGLKEHSRIANQNPLKNPSSKLSAGSSLKRPPKEIKHSCKVIFLSPDQQKAFQGPPRQLICGAAGTGKTIVLQTKAMQCLAKGESVVVLAQLCYMKQYEILFESNDFKNYKIYDWKSLYAAITAAVYVSNAVLAATSDNNSSNCVAQWKNISSNKLEWLVNSDSVFIDDALDTVNATGMGHRSKRTFKVILKIMKLAQKVSLSKIVWVGVDPYDFDGMNLVLAYWIDSIVWFNEKYFHSAKLQQIMRSSENIFRTAYYDTVPDVRLPRLLPVSGHKIQGVTVTTINLRLVLCDPRPAAWDKIKSIIAQFSRQGFDLEDVAILVAEERDAKSRLYFCEYLIEKCGQNFPDLKPSVKFWNDVSSLEWPAVIWVSCFYRPNIMKYQRYRAMSRATSILIDLRLHIERPRFAVRKVVNANVLSLS